MDWDSDSAISSDERPVRKLPHRAAKVKTPTRPNRLTRATVAYFSHSSQASGSDADALGSSGEDENTTIPADSRSRKRNNDIVPTLASKRRRRNPAKKGTGSPANRSRPVRTSPAKKPLPVPKPDIVLNGEWDTLPYMVWLMIFDHVAAPLRDVTARPEEVNAATTLLLHASRTSKALTEPALTALYKSPPLSPGAALLLSRRLTLGEDIGLLNYRPKIETLRIEVDSTLGRKVAGYNVSLKDLIQSLPRLKDVELYHTLDRAPYRQLDVNIRWKYPDELFEALAFVPDGEPNPTAKKTPTELRSWMWSSRLAGESCSLDKLEAIHKTPSFANLRKITFVNYQVPSLNTLNADDAAIVEMDLPKIQQMAVAIGALPHLEHLVFESSTIVNAALLNSLPKGLKHLQLINCWDVTADTLREFLLTHGHSLDELTLEHCQALSLAFLPVLGTACPNLTHLTINLKYFRYLDSYNDADPDYKDLLGDGQVPTWPSSLEYLDIQHMRHWGGSSEIETARVFFKSLTDSASTLPHLRHISLKAMINAPIRERSKFRDKWVPRMEDVFKRPFVNPKPVPRRPKAIPPLKKDKSPESTKVCAVAVPPSRRSTRIAERPPTETLTSEVPSASERELKVMARLRNESKRLTAQMPQRDYNADDEDSDDVLGTGEGPAFKQRLCTVVDIQVDNQKLGENQFGMTDFMDDSPEDNDDDDWDGTDLNFS
ncbi:hypothetical protein BX600DRAFT_450066 [Xylariales sp. PMI_506]|nr:hypothetical protein BX600DRAFT_450066 [Xylariales sp. PMI_506]